MAKQLNIAVIGAGVMGLCTAHALKTRGAFVTVYDAAGFPANNASHAAGGMLAPFAEIDHLPAPFTNAGLEGIKFWEGIKDSGFKKTGSLIIAHDEDKYMLRRFAQKLPDRKPTDVATLEPLLKNFGSGIFIPEEAHIIPRDALNALLAKQTHLVAQPFNMNQSTNYDWVIDCRGMSADDKELRGVKGETIIVRNPEFTLNRALRLMHPRYPLYIVPRPDHHFMIGATVIETEGDGVSVRSAMELLSAVYSVHPSFADADIVEINAGVRPAYADNLPHIRIDKNIIRCNGLFRHGFLLAPVMAACVTDHITGKQNEHMNLFTRTHEHHNQRPENNRKRA